MSNTEKMLDIRDLSVIYKTDLETVYAVNDVTLSLEKGATLGLVVRGDSMEPVITDGSIVWVDGTAIPHSGDIGVFLIDGEATCKKLVRVNGRYVLRSLNSAYDDIEPADWQDVRPVGKVVVPRKDYVFRAARDGSLGPITDPEGVYNNRVEGAAINKRVAQLKKEGKLKPHDEF